MSEPNAKPVGGRFQKGQSGNPGGRAKLPPSFVEAMRERLPRCLEIIDQNLRDAKNWKRQADTVELVLAYAVGRPKQAVEHSGEGGGPIGFQVIRRVVVDPSTGDPNT